MTKTIAVAGTGGVARYLIEELLQHKYKVAVLTRNNKDFLAQYDVSVRLTDYSVDDLTAHLQDCEGIVSAVSPSTPQTAVEVHLALLEACKRSPKCKHYIPSFWSSNIEEYPEQPMGSWEKRGPILQALQAQTDVKWTITIVSWFMDYIIPVDNRYLRNIGGIFPMDWSQKVFTIWGKGRNQVNLCSARDASRAVAALMEHQDWEPYTFLSGTQCSWLDVADAVKRRDPSWTFRSKTLAESVNQLIENKDPYSRYQAIFEITSHSGALELSRAKVEAQREKYFKGLHFRSIDELLDELATNPKAIL